MNLVKDFGFHYDMYLPVFALFYSYVPLLSKLKCLFQTEKCGMGVVAEEDINQGDFVIEYVGEG